MSLIDRLPQWQRALLEEARAQARKSLGEGGLPIGSAIGNESGVIAAGHNMRVQSGDPTAHAEVVCIRNAGRRRDWHTLTLASTLSPCVMCTGTSLLHRIPRIIVGENRNFMGAEDLFRAHGVELIVVDDPDCIEMMSGFIKAKPELWDEDIGVPPAPEG